MLVIVKVSNSHFIPPRLVFKFIIDKKIEENVKK